MKKSELSRIALMGIASGLMLVSQSAIEAAIEDESADVQYLTAAHKCKGAHGCGGDLTAARDLSDASLDDEDDQDEDDIDNDEEEEAGQEEEKKEGKKEANKPAASPKAGAGSNAKQQAPSSNSAKL